MNVEKCEACWIGRSKGDTDKPVKCKWISLTNNIIKILGTHFSYNKLLVKKMNFYNLVTDCRTLLNIWKQRWLSLAGKIQVFKSLIASKPAYIASMKSLPQDVLDELHRIQKEFPWQGKRAKIKHSTMIGSYEKGGLKDVGYSEYSVARFRRCKYFFHTKLLIVPEKRECLEKIPTFYKEVISTWERICIGTSCDLEFILSQSLWDNHFVRSKGKTIFNKRSESKGILIVVDLIDDDGKFSSWEKMFFRKFNLSAVDFLEWYGILHSIAREWKNKVKENTFLPETLDKQVLSRFHHGVFKGTCFYCIFKIKASHIYEIFVQKNLNLPQQRQRCRQNSRSRKFSGQEYTP